MSEKLQELEEVQAKERWELLTADAKQKQRDNALLLIGGVQVAEKIAKSISSQVMNALIVFQKDNLYRNFGYERFADFLDNSEYSPMTKNQFYDRKKLYDAEGGHLFDLMNEIGISLEIRKILAASNAGDISIEGDQLIIGDEAADLSDVPLIKNLIQKFADDNRELEREKTSQAEKIEKLESTIETGKEEYEELKRNLDAAGSEFERAFSQALHSMVKLTEVSKNLTLVEKETHGENTLHSLWTLFVNLRQELNQTQYQFQDLSAAAVDIDPLVARVMSEADDLD